MVNTRVVWVLALALVFTAQAGSDPISAFSFWSFFSDPLRGEIDVDLPVHGLGQLPQINDLCGREYEHIQYRSWYYELELEFAVANCAGITVRYTRDSGGRWYRSLVEINDLTMIAHGFDRTMNPQTVMDIVAPSPRVERHGDDVIADDYEVYIRFIFDDGLLTRVVLAREGAETWEPVE